MMKDQLTSAFIASLLLEGVDPETIELAVSRTRSIKLGHSISGNDPLVRAFAFEQAKLLDRATK